MEVRQSSAFRREKQKLTPGQEQAIADLFAVLAEPTRLRILQMLQDGPASVGQIVRALELGQANVSKHLQLLHRLGFVQRQKEGTATRYAIADRDVFRLCDLVCGGARVQLRERERLLRR